MTHCIGAKFAVSDLLKLEIHLNNIVFTNPSPISQNTPSLLYKDRCLVLYEGIINAHSENRTKSLNKTSVFEFLTCSWVIMSYLSYLTVSVQPLISYISFLLSVILFHDLFLALHFLIHEDVLWRGNYFIEITYVSLLALRWNVLCRHIIPQMWLNAVILIRVSVIKTWDVAAKRAPMAHLFFYFILSIFTNILDVIRFTKFCLKRRYFINYNFTSCEIRSLKRYALCVGRNY